MAEQCIVCLEDLDHAPPNLDVADPSLVIAENDLGGTPTTTTAAQQHNDANTQHNTASGQLNIAVIQSCSHVLHDVCLREWTQKANSCPICRTQFNKVEVRETTAGTLCPSTSYLPTSRLSNLLTSSCRSSHQRIRSQRQETDRRVRSSGLDPGTGTRRGHRAAMSHLSQSGRRGSASTLRRLRCSIPHILPRSSSGPRSSRTLVLHGMPPRGGKLAQCRRG